MLTKNKQKLLKSLQLKKYRKEEKLFFVEGEKSVLELLESDFEIVELFATKTFILKHTNLLKVKNINFSENDEKSLEQAGSFKTNNTVIALVKQAEESSYTRNDSRFSLVLDDIRDPGNLGTILRIADWYGIKEVICSTECADFYNPKVIQASMGSFCRIKIFYLDLEKFLAEQNANKEAIYGAYLEGENVHSTVFEKSGLLVMGNESNGINPKLRKHINKEISIPNFGKAESLNVAIATAVICDNIVRNRD